MLALDIYSTFYGRNGYEGVGQAKAVMFFVFVAVIVLHAAAHFQKPGDRKLMNTQKHWQERIATIFLIVLAALYLAPMLIVIMNSFKGRFFISDAPFALPDAQTFTGSTNYSSGLAKTGFIEAFGYSLFITVFSVATIVLFIHDGLVHNPRQIKAEFLPFLSAGLFHDRSLPNGDVYHVEKWQTPCVWITPWALL